MQGDCPTQPGRWESPLLPCPATGVNIVVSATHGRGVPPRTMQWVLVNVRPELGYVPGEEIDLVSGYVNSLLPTVWRNAVQVGISHSTATQPLNYHNKSTGAFAALTNTHLNWALKCYCTW